MSKIEQLLAKALSTDSEQEAIECLRMARKQGKSFVNTYKGYSAQVLYEHNLWLVDQYIALRQTKDRAFKTISMLEEKHSVLRRIIIILICMNPISIALTAAFLYFI